MVLCERSCPKEYTYEISIFNYLKGIAKVKVPVYAVNADGDGRADISSPDIGPGSLKIIVRGERSCNKECICGIWKPYLYWFRSYGQG